MALKHVVMKHHSQLVFMLLALLVLGPLLRPGFVLTLDMVFTPNIRLTDITTSSYLFYATLHVLNFIFPADLLQKIILFAILFLSGFGMYRLSIAMFGSIRRSDNASLHFGAYLAAVFCMVNPYTYSRFMAGQFAVLLGYSLLSFFVMSLIKLLAKPCWRQGVKTGILTALIGIVSIHSLGLVAVLLSIACALAAWCDRQDLPKLRDTFLATGIALGVFVALSCNWLVPLAIGHSTTATAIADFTANDDQAFVTLGNGYAGRLANVVRLQGFWTEATHTFLMPQDHIAGWGIIVLVLWALVIIGVCRSWRSGWHFLVSWLLLSTVLAIFIATGAFQGLFAHLPLLHGFREPHKFAGLIALSYALFAGQGVAAILERTRQKSQALQFTAIFLIVILPVTLTHTMFWGFAGQLQPVLYPATWTSMNQRLNIDSDNFQVLFLPWHQYMYFRFADRIIASPAASFFDKPTLTSNDLEFKGASTNFPDARKTLISEQILPAAQTTTGLGAQLVPFGIKYILLDKDNDYKNYAYLDRQTDLQLTEEDANFKLYVNHAFKEPHAPKS